MSAASATLCPKEENMSFPHLDPVFLRLGPLELRWYGLMYIIGFLGAFFLIQREASRRALAFSADDVADILSTLAVGVILGGRLGYVLFYKPSYYLQEPLRIFAVWEGGMSFHGGLLGVALALVWLARRRRMPVLLLSDLVVPSVPLGLGLGRIGNFINGELYGRVTTAPWGMVFPEGGNLPRHPSQLYEAMLEGVFLFAVLQLLARRRPPSGVISGAFLILYGMCRFAVEFYREPDAHLGLLGGVVSMGQLLCIPMMLAGGGMVLHALRRGQDKRASGVS
jgi:phosphatidylglycerol:prolipoprotein diacylglycerol transferase